MSLTNITDGFQLAPNGWMNFFMSFQMVFFAYQLIEFVGVTVSETQNPREVLPKAVNELIMRILIFYVGALIAIMAIVPWRNFHENSDGSFGSPFIMVFKYAGLDWAAALVFFVVITAAASALNSLIYSAGRHLYQLASDSESPAMARLAEVSDTRCLRSDRRFGLHDSVLPDHQRDSGYFRRVRAIRFGRQRCGDFHLRADDARPPQVSSEQRFSTGRFRHARLAGV